MLLWSRVLGCCCINGDAKRLQSATDAGAGGVLADVQRVRQRPVVLFLDHAQAHGFALVDRQRLELLGDVVAQLPRTCELLDALVLDVGQGTALDPEASERASLHAGSLEVVGQTVAGDAIQPRQRSVVVPPAEATTALERHGEGLGQDVHRHLGIPGAADQERQDRLRVTVIKVRDFLRAQSHTTS